MSAFERLQSYSARSKSNVSVSGSGSGNQTIETVSSEPDLFDEIDAKLFDRKTPTGYFLRAIHKNGYKVIENVYIDGDGNKVNEERFLSLPDSEKSSYTAKCVKSELCEALTTTGDQLIISSAGSGKALENSTLVKTSKGDKAIGDLTLNNEVIGSDLKPHRIVGIFPQSEKKKAYKITVGSGEVIKSCGEHLWTLENGETFNTEYLFKTYFLNGSCECLPLKNFGSDLFADEVLTDYQKSVAILSFLGVKDLASLYQSTKDEWMKHDKKGDFDEYLFALSRDKNFGFYADLSDRKDELVNLHSDFLKVCEALNIPVNFERDEVDGLLYSNDFFSVRFRMSVDHTICITSHPFIFSDFETAKSIEDLYNRCQSIANEGVIDLLIEEGKNRIESGRFNYIKSIEETDEYLDMTCIQIDAEDKLYLLSCGVLTHNTTALVFKIMLDILNGEATKVVQIPNGQPVRVVDSIFVGTFLKSGAEELETRLGEEQRRYGYEVTAKRISFGTLHAEFYRALVAMGVPISIGKPEVLRTMLYDSIKSMGVQRVGGSGALTNEDLQIIESVITYCRGRLDNQRYNHPAVRDYTNLTPTFMDTIIRSYKKKKEDAKIMDFEDLQELLYQYLYVTPNSNVQDFIANRYKYIYLDEFQDTSQIQYAILKFYARGRAKCNRLTIASDELPKGYYTGIESVGKIVAIGDDDQCVVGDSMIATVSGEKRISDIKEGEFVLSYCGDNETTYLPVDHMFKKKYKGKVVRLKTESGKTLVCTPDHPLFCSVSHSSTRCERLLLSLVSQSSKSKDGVCFSKLSCSTFDTKLMSILSSFAGFECNVASSIGKPCYDCVYTTDNLVRLYEVVDSVKKQASEAGIVLNVIEHISIGDRRRYYKTEVSNIHIGSYILTIDENCEVMSDAVESITEEDYDDFVYDISVPASRNFIVQDIVSRNCIYSWRGSDINILCSYFDKDFAPSICNLSYNYRCPSTILDPIIKSISLNKVRADKKIQASRVGGELNAYHFTSIKNMLTQLSKDIDRDMNDGVSIAILCRTNFNGVVPAFMLEMEHKYNFSISSDQMTLSSALPRKILSMTCLFTERTTKNVQNALEMFVYRGFAWKIKELVQTLKNDDMNSKRTSIWTMDERDIEYSCPEILPFVRAVKSIIIDVNGKRVQENEIEALKYIYKYMKASVFGGDTAYCESARAYIDAMLYLLETKDFQSVFDFQEEVQGYNERLKGRVGKKNTKISIVTVHEFKGKERDSTYVWNDSDMVFPSSKTDVNDEKQMEEERRVHYIACTRARKRNTIYSIRGKEGIFLKEMELELTDPIPVSGVLPSNANQAYEEEKAHMEEVLSEFEFDDTMPSV